MRKLWSDTRDGSKSYSKKSLRTAHLFFEQKMYIVSYNKEEVFASESKQIAINYMNKDIMFRKKEIGCLESSPEKKPFKYLKNYVDYLEMEVE